MSCFQKQEAVMSERHCSLSVVFFFSLHFTETTIEDFYETHYSICVHTYIYIYIYIYICLC